MLRSIPSPSARTELFRVWLASAFVGMLAACAPRAARSHAASPTPGPPRSETSAAVAPARDSTTHSARRSTSSGVSFTLPTDWEIIEHGRLQVMVPPEPGSYVGVFDVEAESAEVAVARAWTAFRPEMKRRLKLTTLRPARNGWDEVRQFAYESAPSEHAICYAQARRRNRVWTVFMVDAEEAAYERCISQITLITDTLRPKGFVKESFAGRSAHSLDSERIGLLSALVERAQHELGIPGVALSLVDQGKVVFEGGFGVRQLGSPAPVTHETLFPIASNTKSLTTLLLAKLVDEGRLTWETPVSAILPGFKLGNAETTSRALVRHLVCACTGLPSKDAGWVFEYENATARDQLALLATIQPTTNFGEIYQYSNLLGAAAGFVAGHTAYPAWELGRAYDEAMRTRVFGPLGMTSTTFEFEVAMRGNYARPHGHDVDGVPAPAKMGPNTAVWSVRPTGGAWSNVRDLSRYVQLELARGKSAHGTQLISEENLIARRTPGVLKAESVSYGMGLEIDTTWGVPVIHHGGALFGYASDIVFLPESGVGAVLLTNSNTGSILLRLFVRRLLEVLFDGRQEASEDLATRAASFRATIAQEREGLVIPADATTLGQLARRYTSSELGTIAIEREDAHAILDLGEWQSRVATRLNDDGSSSLVTIDPAIAGWFEFLISTRDGKRAIIFRERQHEYVFIEAP